MTKNQKISAGYFNQNTSTPVYTGDVFKEANCICPYYMVIKTDSGFKIAHLGSDEVYDFGPHIKNLLDRTTYMGNYFEDKDSLDNLFNLANISVAKYFGEVANDIPEDAPEDVKAFLNGETDELPEGTEVISEAEAEELEKQALEIEKATTENSSEVQELDSDAVELSNNETVVMDMSTTEIEPEEGDAVVSAEATTGPKEETTPEETTEKTTPETPVEEKTEEKKTEPIDVIASNKEEKRLQERRNDYKRAIDQLERKTAELETEAVKYENIASTLTFEPFVELKMIVSNAVQDYAKKQDIKECEKHLKNYKAIDSMEALLREYKKMAEDNRANIALNEKEIDDYKIKIEELNDKLNNFQRKLALDIPEETTEQATEEPKSETVKNDKPVEESTAENSQPEPKVEATTTTDAQPEVETEE